MPLELWEFNRIGSLTVPDHPVGYILLVVYLGVLIFLISHYRQALYRFTGRQWLIIGGLALLALICSRLFPIPLTSDAQLSPLAVAQNPTTTLTLLAAIPFLWAGAAIHPVAALLVGLFSGLGHAMGTAGHLFEIFHFGFTAVFSALLMQLPTGNRLREGLRQPIVAAALGSGVTAVLAGFTAYIQEAPTVVSNTDTIINLAALDLALSTIGGNFWPWLIEALFGGLVVAIILIGVPQLRAQTTVIQSAPPNLQRKLLLPFAIMALVSTIAIIVTVFSLTIHVSTQNIVNQMASSAQAVSAEIPSFLRDVQRTLQASDTSLLAADQELQAERLGQLHRTSPLYRRVFLVQPDQTVGAFFPNDVTQVELTELEQTAVDRTLTTESYQIVAAEGNNSEHVLSFAVPVYNAQAEAAAVLIGRVPTVALKNLLRPGRALQQTGFILDEQSQIIAHPNDDYLLADWPLVANPTRLIETELTVPGIAYLGRQSETNARELVYRLTDPAHPWTVVMTVPYDVVLAQALQIGSPLAAVLVLVMLAFAAHLVLFSHTASRPLAELITAAEKIATGETWTPQPLQPGSIAEINALNSAMSNLQTAHNRRVGELSLLLNVSKEVSSNIDIEQGIKAILRGAYRGLHPAGVRAVVLNPSEGAPLAFGIGPADKAMASLDRRVMTCTRYADQLILSSLSEIQEALQLQPQEQLPMHALMALPINIGSRFMGILWTGYREPHYFDESERKLLRTLTGQTAVLVTNARNYIAARNGRERLEAILASTSEAIIATDATNRVLFFNAAMEQFFAIAPGEVAGRAVKDVLIDSDLAQAMTAHADKIHDVEVTLANGKTFFASISNILRSSGTLSGRVAVLKDISHYKEIDELKSEFVQTVSHDLRGPLTFMGGYAAMLPLAGNLTEQQTGHLNHIRDGIRQMTKLVNDLLDLGRIEAGVDFHKDDIVEVNALLQDIRDQYWQHAHMSGLRLKVDVADAMPTLPCDKAMVRQAITNLVENGLKYAKDSGDLTMRAIQQNGDIVISVQDHGPGLPPESKTRIFEKFYRVKEKGKERIKGTGLGLAIVKSAAQRHGGDAWCQSELGKGTTFYISLPLES